MSYPNRSSPAARTRSLVATGPGSVRGSVNNNNSSDGNSSSTRISSRGSSISHHRFDDPPLCPDLLRARNTPTIGCSDNSGDDLDGSAMSLASLPNDDEQNEEMEEDDDDEIDDVAYFYKRDCGDGDRAAIGDWFMLPTELLSLIFEFVEPGHATRAAACVCSRWAGVMRDDILWHRIHDRFLGGQPRKKLSYRKSCLSAVRDLEDVGDNWGPNCSEKAANVWFYAIKRGHKVLVRRLLRNGADVDVTDNRQRTALHVVCKYGGDELSPFLPILLAFGANIEACNLSGWRPLHYAAWMGRADVVASLLAAKADPLARSKGNRQPLHYACWRGHINVVKNLVSHRPSVFLGESSREGKTPLHYACERGHTEVVRVLVDAGAAVHTLAANRSTPLTDARANGHTEIVGILMQKLRDISFPPSSTTGHMHTPQLYSPPTPPGEGEVEGDAAKIAQGQQHQQEQQQQQQHQQQFHQQQQHHQQHGHQEEQQEDDDEEEEE